MVRRSKKVMMRNKTYIAQGKMFIRVSTKIKKLRISNKTQGSTNVRNDISNHLAKETSILEDVEAAGTVWKHLEWRA